MEIVNCYARTQSRNRAWSRPTFETLFRDVSYTHGRRVERIGARFQHQSHSFDIFLEHWSLRARTCGNRAGLGQFSCGRIGRAAGLVEPGIGGVDVFHDVRITFRALAPAMQVAKYP